MRLSLIVGVFMLGGKMGAWWFTGSSAIFADAAESVVHVFAVGFAAFSLHLSVRPPNSRFLYGYERIAFFSAGFEGALIILAAVTIIVSSIKSWLAGLHLANLGAGTLVVFAAALINGALGWFLIRTGRRHNSLILEANGRHVLTDFWTSLGVVVGLGLAVATGWNIFDPILAIATALHILWSGGKLVWRSVGGLLDYADPSVGRSLREHLDAVCAELGVQYHGVRFRHTGHRFIVNIDLLFPYRTALGEAHNMATELERRLPARLDFPVEIITHLESLEDHAEVHPDDHYTGRPV
jgi:cation diffusion facilitator family transporter